MSNKLEHYHTLKNAIDKAYTEGVSIIEAERLAALTLGARFDICEELTIIDLDARMKKHGVKAVRGQSYLTELEKHEKKPNEAYLESKVNLDPLVKAEEKEYAQAEVESEYLHALSDIFKDAHHYFKAIMRGTMDT